MIIFLLTQRLDNSQQSKPFGAGDSVKRQRNVGNSSSGSANKKHKQPKPQNLSESFERGLRRAAEYEHLFIESAS